MAPHRFVAPSTALGMGVTAGNAAAGVGATVLSFATGLHAWLFVAVLVTMMLELWTHPGRPANARAAAKWEFAEVKSKGRRMLVPIFCVVIDAVLLAAAYEVGQSPGLLSHGVVSAFALGWLWRVEGKAFLANIRHTEGDQAVPPGLDDVLDVIPGRFRREAVRANLLPPGD